MSFGGGGFRQGVEFEMSLIGGDVADDVTRKQMSISESALLAAESMRQGVISGDQLVKMLAQMHGEYDKLQKRLVEYQQVQRDAAQAEADAYQSWLRINADRITQAENRAAIENQRRAESIAALAAEQAADADSYQGWLKNNADRITAMENRAAIENQRRAESIQALRDEAQAAAETAAVMENLARMAEARELARIESVMAAMEAVKQAAADEAQGQRDLAAIRDSLGRAMEARERERIEAILEAAEAVRKAAADEAQGQRDLAAIRDSLGRAMEARERERIEAILEAAEAEKRAKQDVAQAEKDMAAVRDALGRAEEAREKDRIEAIVAEQKAEADAYQAWLATHANRMTAAEARERQEIAAIAARKKAGEDAVATAQFEAAAYKMVDGDARRYAQALDQLREEEELLPRAVIRANEAVKTQAQILQEAQVRQMQYARAATFTAQGIEDLQYGFSAFVNNIPLITNEVGKIIGLTPQVAMGFSAIASIGGVALTQIIKHWDGIHDAMSRVATGEFSIESILTSPLGLASRALDSFSNAFAITFENTALTKAERLKLELKEVEEVTKDLGGRTRLTQADMNKYEDAKKKVEDLKGAIKELDDLEKLREQKSDREQAAGSAFARAFANNKSGEGDLTRALGLQADAKGQVASAALGQSGTVDEISRKLILAAKGGNTDAIDEIRKLIKDQFGGRNTPFTLALDEIDRALPAFKAAQDEAKNAFTQITQEAKDQAKALKDFNKEAADLTLQGQENERKWREEMRDETNKDLTAQGKAFEGPAKKELKDIAKEAQSELTADQKTAGQFGGGMQAQIQMFMLEQQRIRAENEKIGRGPRGAINLKARQRQEARRRAGVARAIKQRNRDPMFRQQMKAASPEQRAALAFQDRMNLNAGAGMDAGAAREFLKAQLGISLQAGGVPGAANNDRALRMAGMIEDRAEKANSAMVANGMMGQGDVVESVAAAQQTLMGQMARLQQQNQRTWNLVNGVRRGVDDMRGADLNSGTEGF